MPDNYRELFLEAEPYLVGVWKYRENGKSPKWCATVLHNGSYFDVSMSDTIIQALEKVLESVR